MSSYSAIHSPHTLNSFTGPEQFNTFSHAVSAPFDVCDPAWRKELPPLPPPAPQLPSHNNNINATGELNPSVNTHMLALKREESLQKNPYALPLPFPFSQQTSSYPLFLARRQTSNGVNAPTTPSSSLPFHPYSPYSLGSSSSSPHDDVGHHSSPLSDQSVESECDGDGDEPPFHLQLHTQHSPDTTNSTASSTVADTPSSSTPSPVNFECSPGLPPVRAPIPPTLPVFTVSVNMNLNLNRTAPVNMRLQRMPETEGGNSISSWQNEGEGDQKPVGGFSLSLHTDNSSSAPFSTVSTGAATSAASSPSSSSSSSFPSSFSFSSLRLSCSSPSHARAAYLSCAHHSYNFHSIKSLSSSDSSGLFAVQLSASRNHKILENKCGTQFMLKDDQKSKRWPRKYLSIWPSLEIAFRWIEYAVNEWPELCFLLSEPSVDGKLIVVEDTDAKLHHEVYSLVSNQEEVEKAVRGVRKKRHESRYASCTAHIIQMVPTAICASTEINAQSLLPLNEILSGQTSEQQSQNNTSMQNETTRQQARSGGRRRNRAVALSASTASSSSVPASSARALKPLKVKQEACSEFSDEEEYESRRRNSQVNHRKKPRSSVNHSSHSSSSSSSPSSSAIVDDSLLSSDDLPCSSTELQLQLSMSTETQSNLSMEQSESGASLTQPIPLPPLTINRTTSLSFSLQASASASASSVSMPSATPAAIPSVFDCQPSSPVITNHHHSQIINNLWPAFNLPLPVPAMQPIIAAVNPSISVLASPSGSNSNSTFTSHLQSHFHGDSGDGMDSVSGGVGGGADDDIRSFGFALPLPSATPMLSQQNSYTNSFPNPYHQFQFNSVGLDYSFNDSMDANRSILPLTQTLTQHAQHPETKSSSLMTSPIPTLVPTPISIVQLHLQIKPSSAALSSSDTTSSSSCSVSNSCSPTLPLPLPQPLPPVLPPVSACAACGCSRLGSCSLKDCDCLACELAVVLHLHSTLSVAIIRRFLRESVDDICCLEDLIEYWEYDGATRLCEKAGLTEIQVSKITKFRKKLLTADEHMLQNMMQQANVQQSRQHLIQQCLRNYDLQQQQSTKSAPQSQSPAKHTSDPSASPVPVEVLVATNHFKPTRALRLRSMSDPAINIKACSKAQYQQGKNSSSSFSSHCMLARSSFDDRVYSPSVTLCIADDNLRVDRHLWTIWSECVQRLKTQHRNEEKRHSESGSENQNEKAKKRQSLSSEWFRLSFPVANGSTMDVDFVFESLRYVCAFHQQIVYDANVVPLQLRAALMNGGDSLCYSVMKRALGLAEAGQLSTISTHINKRTCTRKLDEKRFILSILALNATAAKPKPQKANNRSSRLQTKVTQAPVDGWQAIQGGAHVDAFWAVLECCLKNWRGSVEQRIFADRIWSYLKFKFLGSVSIGDTTNSINTSKRGLTPFSVVVRLCAQLTAHFSYPYRPMLKDHRLV